MTRITSSGLLCALALVALGTGCGGDSDEDGDTSPAAGSPSVATGAPPPQSTPEESLRTALGDPPAGLVGAVVTCAPKGQDFTCRVRGTRAGQAVSGTIELAAQGTGGTRFLGRGRLAGEGVSIRLSGITIDLNVKRISPGPSPAPSLEDQIKARLTAANPNLSLGTLKCPKKRPAGRGATFTCKGEGTYQATPITADIEVTQTDAAGKRFELNGDIVDIDQGEKIGSITGADVALP